MPARSHSQPGLFTSPACIPLRALAYEAKIQRMWLASRRVNGNSMVPAKSSIGLEMAVSNLTRAVDAILDADTVGMRLAGITPSMALELAKRLTSAAGALETRKR